MKKLLILLTAAVMVVSAAFADEAPETLLAGDGITLGMSQSALISVFNGIPYEIESEHTHGPVSFLEVELENQDVCGLPADVHYLFAGGALVGLELDFGDSRNAYGQVRALLVEHYGEPSAVDTALLGNGIYAVDDDGLLEAGAEAWTVGNTMIVLEKDNDGEANLGVVDVSAPFVR